MIRRYRYEIMPGPAAQQSLARAFGCARVVFNDYVAANRARHLNNQPFLSDVEAQRLLITAAKKAPEREWLAEVSVVLLQQSIRDAGTAYRNFFNSLSGRRKGRRVGLPKFKSKHQGEQSIRFTVNGFSIRGGHTNTHPDNPTPGRLYLAKIGTIPVRWSRALPSAPKSVTITHTPDGRYFASFTVDVPEKAAVAPAHPGRVAGIDLGLNEFAAVVYSDGTREIIDNPRFARAAARRLSRAQKSLNRKVKGSKNRAKQKRRVASLHRHVANQRLDHAHQVAARLIRENQTIAVETLSITGLARTSLAKSIHDAGWGQFLSILGAKAVEQNRTVAAAPAGFPSTRACTLCGTNSGAKPLHVRIWTCACGAVLDRDYNAATNLLMVAGGHSETLNACGADVRRHLARPRSDRDAAIRDEAGTRPTRTPSRVR
ncbi:RNA-guided endonuclease InsQ/TnpB family protein [Leifsonia sp. Leaf264]|uniref:RNA-guided endonuclease InsQ/TnpB family protein n=1 Tax=Leifsonia sp. Leaf264 TaxID=1736314 RepID=UPI0009E7A48F|nr:RNA-guided endonuclease TnpB family protein [Leifsonia sp. Leaf264]